MPQYECPYESDPSLANELVVYRFLSPALASWGPEGCEIQSHSFREIGRETAELLGYTEPAMSIAFHDQIIAAGRTVEEVAELELGPGCGIAQLTVGEIRSVKPELGILRDGGESNPWHGIVFAVTRKQMKQERGRLRDLATIVRYPDRPADA